MCVCLKVCIFSSVCACVFGGGGRIQPADVIQSSRQRLKGALCRQKAAPALGFSCSRASKASEWHGREAPRHDELITLLLDQLRQSFFFVCLCSDIFFPLLPVKTIAAEREWGENGASRTGKSVEELHKSPKVAAAAEPRDVDKLGFRSSKKIDFSLLLTLLFLYLLYCFSFCYGAQVG